MPNFRQIIANEGFSNEDLSPKALRLIALYERTNIAIDRVNTNKTFAYKKKNGEPTDKAKAEINELTQDLQGYNDDIIDEIALIKHKKNNVVPKNTEKAKKEDNEHVIKIDETKKRKPSSVSNFFFWGSDEDDD